MHGARGAALGHLSQKIKRTQLERDRVARGKRLNSKQHMAVLKARIDVGGPVGGRCPQPAPVSATPLADEFYGRRGERAEPLAPLYPGSRK
jgi:hypothetical protein